MTFENKNGALICYKSGEQLKIEPWGADSLRVRATMQTEFTGKDWALTEKIDKGTAEIIIAEEDFWVGDGNIAKQPVATIINGRVKAVVNFAGVITFYRDDKIILREYFRSYGGTL